MFKFIFYFILSALSLFALEDYKIFIKEYHDSVGNIFVVLRQWREKGQINYLIVNTQTLETKITTRINFPLTPLTKAFEKTHFATILHQKDVLSEASAPVKKSLFLTMDMCPSLHKGYEDNFLKQLTDLYGKTPIAIAISSTWIQTHEKEFDALAHNPLLDITWINHTHTHFYDPTLPNNENFMLHASTDVKKEILELEKSLIQRGVTPSVFFRFPGLIYNENLLNEIKNTYFLVPIGSHAWVAKGEKIRNKSIILIHGNKNEPYGIHFLERKLPELHQNYSFKPLSEAF